MTVNRGVWRHRSWMTLLLLVFAFSTSACATLLALPTNNGACMEAKEFARLYTDFWIGPEGNPIRALENAFYAILAAPVASLSYSVENQICHSSKGQSEQGQLYNFFTGPPEPGQPLVPVEATAPERDEGEIAAGNDACTGSEDNLQPRRGCE